MNTFGTLFRLTSFGESHGPGIGGVVDGMPAGIVVDMDFVRSEMRRRRPGQSAVTTGRHEPDEVEFLSAANAGSASSSDYHAAVSAPAAPRMQQAPSFAPADSGFTQVDDDELPF